MEMAMKNMCEVLTFRPPTVGKLLSFLNTGRDSGEGEVGAAESGLCLFINVWGTLGFILIFVKLLS